MFNPFAPDSSPNSYSVMHSLADRMIDAHPECVNQFGERYAYFNYDGLRYRVIQSANGRIRGYYYRHYDNDFEGRWKRLVLFVKDSNDNWIVNRNVPVGY